MCEEKQCCHCKEWFPATKEYFNTDNRLLSGLTGRCKKCKTISALKILKGIDANITYKKCAICGKEKTLNEFNHNKVGIMGRRSNCRECQNEITRKYKHSERGKEKNRKWMQTPKGKAYAQRYRDKPKTKEKNKQNRNKKEFKARTKIYHQRRRALKKELRATLTDEQWNLCLEYFQNTCAYCGNKENNLALAQDHVIPLSKGGEYTINNIIPCCRSCNSKKSNKDLLEWYTPKLDFYSELRKKKILKYLKTNGEIQQLALEF